MENLSFTAGLERVLAWIQANDGMWPAVAFRLLAITAEQGAPPTVRTWVAHFQASTTPQPSRSKVRLQAPLVLEGVIGISEFKDWLLNWSDGRATSIDGWDLPPPAGITFMSFDKDVTVAPDYYPLLEELPAFATPYREVRPVRLRRAGFTRYALLASGETLRSKRFARRDGDVFERVPRDTMGR
jgi:hypothetical protein